MTAFSADELASFADSVDRFVLDRCQLEQQRALAASADGFSRTLWHDYAGLGWLALPIPESHGGLGGGAAELGVVFDAVGRGLLLEPLLATIVLGAGALAAGSDTQQAAILPEVASGAMLLALAFTERDSGHDRHPTGTIATPNGDGVRLTGAKSFVLHGNAADRLIVSARIGVGGETGLFLVDPAAPGVTRTAYRLIDSRQAADITLADTPAERLDGEDAAAILDRTLDLATTLVCAESVGAIAALNRATVEHARTRRQFGKTIGSFQALQHRMVDMMIAEQEARAITRAALAAIDAGAADAWRIVSAAKARTAAAGRFVGEQAIQIHGGVGMGEELAVGHHFKRLLLNGAFLGDTDWHLARFLGDAA